jgi:hypothetical protein
MAKNYCSKHGYYDGVYCPACEYERVVKREEKKDKKGKK